MNLGKLNKLITIYSVVVDSTSIGKRVVSKTIYKTCWGQVIDVRSIDMLKNGYYFEQQIKKVRMHFDSAINVTNEVMIDDVDYNIMQVTELGNKEGLELLIQSKGN